MNTAPPTNENPRMGSEGDSEESQEHHKANSAASSRQAYSTAGSLAQIVSSDFEGCLTISYPDHTKPRRDGSPSWRSRHAETIAEAAATAKILAPKHDVYFGVGIRRKGLRKEQRGKKDDVIALPAFFADLDVAGPNHQANGKVYFADREALLAFADSLPLRPSLIVWSGGGAHLYWILKEPWLLADAAERDAADRQLKAWGAYLSTRAREAGVDIDPVQEIARVLRVPGSINHKNGGAEPVTVIASRLGLEFDVSDFDEWAIPEAAAAKNATAGTAPLSIVVRPDAEPPERKFDVLVDNSKPFAQAWKRRRPSMKDQSPSAYCLSLATYAAQGGWADQEITDLLVAWRRRHDATVKPAGWYAITIAKARKGHEEEASDHPEGCRCSECAEGRQTPTETLGATLGLSVARIIKRGQVGGTYELKLADGSTVILGDAAALLSFRICRAAVLDTAARVLPAGLRNSWPDVAALVARGAEVVELPGEDEEVIAWLTDHVSEADHNHTDSLELFLEIGPHGDGDDRIYKTCEDGRDVYYFSMRNLLRKISWMERVPITAKSFQTRLSRVGCKPLQLSMRVAGRANPRKKRAWRWCPHE